MYGFIGIISVIAIIAISFFAGVKTFKTKKNGASAVKTNLAVFAICTVLFTGSALGASAVSADANAQTANTSAAETQTAETAPVSDNNKGMAFIASALAIGLAGIGGGIAVAAAAPAAIGATSEDQKNFVKSLIFVALGEAIALYGFLISFLIYSTASQM